MCAEEYNVAQLRAWLRKLALPTSGNKSTLALRISSVSANERGVCPTGYDDSSVDIQTEAQGIHTNNQLQVVHEETASNFQIEVGDGNGYNNKGNDGGNKSQSNGNDAGNNKQSNNNDGEPNEREVQLLRREVKLLERENELLRRMAEFDGRAVGASSQRSAEIGASKISKEMLLNILPEFDGKTSIDIWMTQLENVCNAYALNENDKRTLLLSKLKGKALQWVHSKPNFAIDGVNMLLNEMQDVFQSKDSKLVLRKKFEERKWKAGEAFIEYFNEKVLLSAPIQLSEDEFVEYTIEGITDEQLRTQAYMQCYSTRAQLVQAFSKIKLRGEKVAATASQKEIRCYNCNSRGHFAAECKKPKREKGACYACGSTAHRAGECPDRKKIVQLVDEEEYVRYFHFVIKSCKPLNFSLECLIDSGSPISLIRNRRFPKNLT